MLDVELRALLATDQNDGACNRPGAHMVRQRFVRKMFLRQGLRAQNVTRQGLVTVIVTKLARQEARQGLVTRWGRPPATNPGFEPYPTVATPESV